MFCGSFYNHFLTIMKNQMTSTNWTFSVAPMLDWTTNPCRRLHRVLLPQARLYSEMVTTGAIIHGDKDRHLLHAGDMPCALQLGGGAPDELARATAIAQAYDYAEINLNVGCPSDRVQNNQIGACLMKTPRLVAQCLQAMQKESDVPITVKHRLGIDEQDERMVFDFIDCLVNESDCRIFIVHARKAWLQGLSPKANRNVPPLNYDLVYEIKQKYPDCTIILNGGIESISACQQHLAHVDGVMLGRAAYQNPSLLLQARILFGEPSVSEEEILPALTKCIADGLARGESLTQYTRHLLGLFSGRKGAKKYRRILSEDSRASDARLDVWHQALSAVSQEVIHS